MLFVYFIGCLQYKQLRLLVLNLNKTVTREQIERELWGKLVADSSEQSLNNYVAKLRKYLAEEPTLELETIPRVGYRLSRNGAAQ